MGDSLKCTPILKKTLKTNGFSIFSFSEKHIHTNYYSCPSRICDDKNKCITLFFLAHRNQSSETMAFAVPETMHVTYTLHSSLGLLIEVRRSLNRCINDNLGSFLRIGSPFGSVVRDYKKHIRSGSLIFSQVADFLPSG